KYTCIIIMSYLLCQLRGCCYFENIVRCDCTDIGFSLLLFNSFLTTLFSFHNSYSLYIHEFLQSNTLCQPNIWAQLIMVTANMLALLKHNISYLYCCVSFISFVTSPIFGYVSLSS